MMIKNIKKIICAILISHISYVSLRAMTYDNRHFPLLDKPILNRTHEGLFLRGQPFFMMGSKSFGVGDEETGLFDIYGIYDEGVFNDALILAGRTTTHFLAPSEAKNLIWSFAGKSSAGGCAFQWYYSLCPYFDVGGTWFFMGASTQMELILLDAQLRKASERRDASVANAEMFKVDGLDGLLWDRFGVSDLDIYLRTGICLERFLKFRTINAGIKFGTIFPTAAARSINDPGSVPFGGNGHWGIYVDAALDTELKEDIFAGFNIRFIQRIGKNQIIRFPVVVSANPVVSEPLNVAVEVGPGHVNPGLTFVFSPYAAINDFRDGFGAQLSYTLIMHGQDTIRDDRVNKNVPVAIDVMQERSSWALEYVTCSLLYDFAHDKECRGCLPWMSLDVDIPVSVLASKRSNKTFGVSLRIESNIW